MKTPLAFRTAQARVTTPEIGGSILVEGDEEFYTRHKVWKLNRPKEERPCVES